ncbi:MAG: hypothetical protein AVDCRST_MAG18-3, partial [uncultured Thermomicrobiales bacterium]
ESFRPPPDQRGRGAAIVASLDAHRVSRYSLASRGMGV